MLKCVACDVDGTLLRSRYEKLSDQLINQIKELHSYGVRFIVASGRPYGNLQRVFAPVSDIISYIAENGALCFHEGELIHKEPLPRDAALSLLQDILDAENCEILLATPNISLIQPKTEKYFDFITRVADYDAKKMDNILETKEEIVKISLCEFDGAGKWESYFTEKYQDRLDVVTSGSIWIDFMKPNTNKGAALKKFFSLFSIQPEEAIAFGDQFNDAEMLQLVGCGYAVEDAVPGVKALADKTCRRVEDVLEEELQKLRANQ